MFDLEEHEKEQAELRRKYQPLFDAATKRRAEPEGQDDMRRLSRAFAALAERVALAQKEMAPENPEIHHKCDTLRPGDFSKEAFVTLPSFQELLRQCSDLDMELRICVLHRKDAAVCKDEPANDAALLRLTVYVPGKYGNGYLAIEKDDVSGMLSQNYGFDDVTLMPAEGDSIETGRTVAVRRPLAFKKF